MASLTTRVMEYVFKFSANGTTTCFRRLLPLSPGPCYANIYLDHLLLCFRAHPNASILVLAFMTNLQRPLIRRSSHKWEYGVRRALSAA